MCGELGDNNSKTLRLLYMAMIKYVCCPVSWLLNDYFGNIDKNTWKLLSQVWSSSFLVNASGIFDDGRYHYFINSILCALYSCCLGVLQHCCIFCLLSDYDCALRQSRDGVLMLNLKFLFVTLELVFWDPRLLMRLNKILTIRARSCVNWRFYDISILLFILTWPNIFFSYLASHYNQYGSFLLSKKAHNPRAVKEIFLTVSAP